MSVLFEMSNPCILCGKHEAITEYFEDELFEYCPTHNTNVSVSEFDSEMERLAQTGEAEHECI